jgi:hypothetical protein
VLVPIDCGGWSTMIVSTTSIPKLVSPRAEPPDLSGDLDPIQGAQPPDSSGLRFLGNACSHLSCFCLCGRSGAHGVGREEKKHHLFACRVRVGVRSAHRDERHTAQVIVRSTSNAIFCPGVVVAPIDVIVEVYERFQRSVLTIESFVKSVLINLSPRIENIQRR